MAKLRVTEVPVKFQGETLIVRGTFTPGHPGRLSGPPESCYPEESSEFEIESIHWNGTELPLNVLEVLTFHREDFLEYLANEAINALWNDAAAAEADYAEDYARDRKLEL